MRRTRLRSGPRSLLGFWIVAALAILAADLSLFATARAVRGSVPWLDVSASHMVPDSLRRATSRYLRDSFGVSTARRSDTTVVLISPDARRSIDAAIAGVQAAALPAAMWLMIGLTLLQIPLLLAVVAIFVRVRERALAERNLAIDEWEEE